MAEAGRHISIVDDDDAVRDSVCALLRTYGFSVRDYPSARSFLDDPQRTDTICVLLDLHMPVINGLELLKFLRSEGTTSPVIIMTGRGDALSMSQAHQSNAAAYLHKPVEEESLLHAIQQAVIAE